MGLAKMYPSSLEQLGALGHALEDPTDEKTGKDQKDASGVYRMVGNNFFVEENRNQYCRRKTGRGT